MWKCFTVFDPMWDSPQTPHRSKRDRRVNGVLPSLFPWSLCVKAGCWMLLQMLRSDHLKPPVTHRETSVRSDGSWVTSADNTDRCGGRLSLLTSQFSHCGTYWQFPQSKQWQTAPTTTTTSQKWLKQKQILQKNKQMFEYLCKCFS